MDTIVGHGHFGGLVVVDIATKMASVNGFLVSKQD
jgi:hypothetical protein